MRVLIHTMGTRGDVQPYVALGTRLAARGHDVHLCTSSSFEPFVREYGLNYAPMNNDLTALGVRIAQEDGPGNAAMKLEQIVASTTSN